MRDSTGTTRRRALAGVGTAAVAALAGCVAGVDGSGGSAGSGEYGGWMADVPNYEATVDRTGRSGVTVEVGAGDGFVFAPAAVRVTAGTTVTWRWTGRGSRHNVVERDGGYGSPVYVRAGKTFTHTFGEAGASKYYCDPHRNLGMKGVVDVVEG